ncbi:Uma2 family endonuclease [Pendulispora albinea]|uniref:Uma2 family endonuclease n=1 Tax=Pendulispora albinea TaxID=2741071 RepID=A0ABZ2LZL6_9BACT
MVAVASPENHDDPLREERDEVRREDHFTVLRGATWADYQRLQEIRGDHSAPRIAYCEGTLEIMSPSRHHESIKSVIGRLVEVFCLERGIEFSTVGSWTLEDKEVDRGVEPDESYIFGRGPDGVVPEGAKRPDLAIEVVWTSGGINKLEIYRKLDVREVWFWRRRRFHLYELRGEQYEAIEQSGVLPNIDLNLLATFLDRPTTSQAMRDYRNALRG